VVAAPATGEAIRVHQEIAAEGADAALLGKLVAEMLLAKGAGVLLNCAPERFGEQRRTGWPARSGHQSRASGGKLSEALRARGIEPVEVPVLEIQLPLSFAALDAALRDYLPTTG